MKHLLLSLLVAFMLASCGKDGNKVSSNYSYTDPLSNPNAGNNPQLTIALAQAKSVLENHTTTFGTGSISTTSLKNTTCKEKWIFEWCKNSYTTTTITFKELFAQNVNVYYIYGTTANPQGGSVTQHSAVNVTDRLNYLSSIFARATTIYYSGSIFQVYVGNSEYYAIDTRYPIQANPVVTQTTSSSSKLMYFQLL